MCPIAKYISGTSSAIDIISLRKVRFASFACTSPIFFCSVRSCAPYPMSVTALIISDAGTSPSTVSVAEIRLTEADFTPATPLAARSTAALHAAQLIPVISYTLLN